MGGIGVVRISGAGALGIGAAVTGTDLPPRRATLRRFSDPAGAVIDSGIALAFPGPASFTGEDVVELQGHGGPLVLQLVLDSVIRRGARLARPGEFTERAFLNGKLDLAQAEAVADLIAGASESAVRGAMRSLDGAFSHAVHEIDEAVLALRVYVEAAMDFPEEGADFYAEGRIDARLDDIRGRFDALLGETRQGVLLRDGVSVALVGAPNVGKSSLLNRLSGQDRAIVTDIPGTTRDLIHADLTLDGLPIRIVDTAGLRDTADPVEQEGVRRAYREAARADLVLLIEDHRTPAPEAAPSLTDLERAGVALTRVIRVRNKSDLGDTGPELPADAGVLSVRVSALTGAGIDELTREIESKVGFAAEAGSFTARRRHIVALQDGQTALERAAALLAQDAPPELAAEELRAVHQALGSIVGTVSADELLGEIFSSFCIGK